MNVETVLVPTLLRLNKIKANARRSSPGTVVGLNLHDGPALVVPASSGHPVQSMLCGRCVPESQPREAELDTFPGRQVSVRFVGVGEACGCRDVLSSFRASAG